MAYYKGYLIAFILTILCAESYSYCPSRVSPDEYDNKFRYDDCFKLYRALEVALLENPDNLYQLHEEFFPSSQSTPVYGYVLYDIYYDCNYTDFECTLSDEAIMQWSSSVLLDYIPTYILNSFQLHLLDVIFDTTGVATLSNSKVNKGTLFQRYDASYVYLTLNLTITQPIERRLLTAVLEDLTSWVSAVNVL